MHKEGSEKQVQHSEVTIGFGDGQEIEDYAERIECRVLTRCQEGNPRENLRVPERDLPVMERLRDLDKVAYVRFASVYRQFADVSEFQNVITALDRRP